METAAMFVAASVLFLFIYIDIRRKGRLPGIPGGKLDAGESYKKLAHAAGIFLPWVTVVFPENVRLQTERRLRWAGLEDMTAGDFLALKLFLTALALTVGVLAASLVKLDFFWGAILAAAGYLGPEIWLSDRVTRRQKALSRDVPDFGMFFSTALEAGGSNIDAALVLASEKFGGEIGKEITRVAHDISIGVRPPDALKDMADRCGIEEMSKLVDVVVQAMRCGTPVAEAVKEHAAQVRLLRRFEAEKKAGEAVVKMVFPMLVFIVLPMLIMLAYPALMQITALLRP